jgi:hypothetical protein
MAIVIPTDIASVARSNGDVLVAACLAALPGEDCWAWYCWSNGIDRPRFTVIGREQGVLGVDVLNLKSSQVERVSSTGITVGGRETDPLSETGRRIESLRSRLPSGTPL